MQTLNKVEDELKVEQLDGPVELLVPAAFAVISTQEPALGPWWVMTRSPYV
jgi:hypothetical protein